MMIRHVSGDKFENEYICQQKSHSNFQTGSPYEYFRWCVCKAYQYIHVIKLLFWVQIGQLKAITLICVLFSIPRDTLVKKFYFLRIDIYRTNVFYTSYSMFPFYVCSDIRLFICELCSDWMIVVFYYLGIFMQYSFRKTQM